MNQQFQPLETNTTPKTGPRIQSIHSKPMIVLTADLSIGFGELVMMVYAHTAARIGPSITVYR